MPDWGRGLLDYISFAFDTTSPVLSVPLTCLGLDGYLKALVFWTLFPLLLGSMTIVTSIWASFRAHVDVRGRTTEATLRAILAHALLGSLPVILVISFVFCPMVTSAAFSAFDCATLDNGKQYLRVDYSISCDTNYYGLVRACATVAVLIYPIGIPLLYVVLLLCAKAAILNDEPTEFSSAIRFLHAAYEPHLCFWEVVETIMKVLLVGFARLLVASPVVQFLFGLLVVLCYQNGLVLLRPYRELNNNFLAAAVSFSLICFMVVLILVQVCMPTMSAARLPLAGL